MTTTSQHSTVPFPDRRNEDWRFGAPLTHARAFADLLPGAAPAAWQTDPAVARISHPSSLAPLPSSIGSAALVQLAAARAPYAFRISFPAGEWGCAETPLVLRCTAQSDAVARLHVEVLPGACVHLAEEHTCPGALLCLRFYDVHPGASLFVHLREHGVGNTSRALNISHLLCAAGSHLRHLTTHSTHLWAREETTAEILAPDANLLLLSANRLNADRWLDQHLRQIHHAPGSESLALYKNVLEDSSTAIFAGNIRVLPTAQDTYAYLANHNLLLNPAATAHSLPSLEISANRVRCSHGSTCAPPDPAQLFYLQSRGIPLPVTYSLLTTAFLAEVLSRFSPARPTELL